MVVVEEEADAGKGESEVDAGAEAGRLLEGERERRERAFLLSRIRVRMRTRKNNLGTHLVSDACEVKGLGLEGITNLRLAFRLFGRFELLVQPLELLLVLLLELLQQRAV